VRAWTCWRITGGWGPCTRAGWEGAAGNKGRTGQEGRSTGREVGSPRGDRARRTGGARRGARPWDGRAGCSGGRQSAMGCSGWQST
jgi:hypothetical protein